MGFPGFPDGRPHHPPHRLDKSREQQSELSGAMFRGAEPGCSGRFSLTPLPRRHSHSATQARNGLVGLKGLECRLPEQAISAAALVEDRDDELRLVPVSERPILLLREQVIFALAIEPRALN